MVYHTAKNVYKKSIPLQNAIVGFGCAGYHAAKAIRKIDKKSRIDVFELTSDPPANPMLTTYYASNKIPLKASFPFGSLDKIVKKFNLNFHNNCQVTKLIPESKTLQFVDGSCSQFDKILISTGAGALLPNLPGLPDKRVFVMRTMADAQNFKKNLKSNKVKKAVVVGASMVGIKVAELLNSQQIKTTIADLAPYLFPLAAFENVAKELEQRVEKKGITFKWQVSVTEITPVGIKFSDGEELESDLICLCIGTRANTGFIANSADHNIPAIKINRGIVVDETMQTSVADIYAAGDCAEGNNLQSQETMIIGLWANAVYQGQTAGSNMANNAERYNGNIIHNITHFMDIDFIGLGDNRLTGECYEFGDISRDNYIKVVLGEDKKIRCINIIVNYRASGVLKNHLLKELAGENSQLSLFQKGILLQSGIDQNFIDLIG